MEAQIILNALYQTLIIFNGARERDGVQCNESLTGLPDRLEAAAAASSAAAGLHGCRYEAIRDRIRRDFQCGRDHTNLKQLGQLPLPSFLPSALSLPGSNPPN